MSKHRILSIDTSYDRILTLFSASRKRYYQTLEDDVTYSVKQLTGLGADRDNFLEQCELTDASGIPYFNYLTISSHGSGGIIYNKEFGHEVTLLSEHDPEEIISLISDGRIIYLLACKVADGNLLDKLIKNGALCVVGFSKEPSWGCAAGNDLWRTIDKQLLSCFGAQNFKSSAYRTVVDILDMIENDLASASIQYTQDLKKTREVMKSIVIV